MSFGEIFEREIREQPDVWERIARSDAAQRLADALDGDAVLVGSGSSLFAAQVGALALRRRGFDAHALASTESQAERKGYLGRIVVALSQSGESTDLLAALDSLQPRRVIALTNSPDSSLAKRADVVIDVCAGKEEAIPATKSVTATVAILLRAASVLAGEHARDAGVLLATAQAVRAWLATPNNGAMQAAAEIAQRRDVLFLGTDYGAAIAREAALKFKESTYMHAEGFAAGEFRHGSSAIVDARTALIGIVDRDGQHVVATPMREAAKTRALCYAIGTVEIEGVQRLGPMVDDPYNALAWLVTVQLLALYVARRLGVDSDSPRGLTKAIRDE